MAIKWGTPSGLLTIIKEESEILDSVIVELSETSNDVDVQLISGELPKGITLENVRPHYSWGFQGIAEKIDITKEYGFTLRAYNESEFADRYFTIKVTNKIPHFSQTQSSEISFTETEHISLQFDMIDNDENDRIVKIDGALPNGLVLNDFGLLYGVAESVDETVSYKFSLGIQRDGVIVDTKEFIINIVKISENAEPIWITEEGNIGRIDYKDYSSLFVKAYDPNDYTGDSLVYEIVKGNLPYDLKLEPKTGRISGLMTITNTADYYFTVRVKNAYSYVDREFFIQTNVIKPEQEIVWETDANIGELKVGSQYYIKIKANSQYNVEYHLSWGHLPDGLKFENGLIYGEVKYQEYKDYSFIIEASNGFKTISQLFTAKVVNGLGKNAVDCYFYINHENDDEYNDLLASLDKSSAYEPSNSLYKIPNKPLISICKLNTFDKVLLKDILYYNRPLTIMWDKTYRKEYRVDSEPLYQVFYKGIKEYNSIDTVETYGSDSIAIPSINGIRQLLAEKIYVEQLNKSSVLYDVATQEIVDTSGTKYPNYIINYDEKTKTYYAKSQDEVRYLDVYALREDGTPEQVFATIERDNYIGDENNELYGGDAFTEEWEEMIYGGNANTEEWEEIIDTNYGRYIVKPVKVFEERLNTPIDYVNYLVYEKGTMNLQSDIMFTLAWKPECKFIILNGIVHHIGTIDNPWVYKPELNETQIHDKTIVLPYVTNEDIKKDGGKSYTQFFDAKNEVIDVWKSDIIDAWKPNTQYVIGDIFTYNGLYYRVEMNFISSGVFEDTYLLTMSEDEVKVYTKPYYYPTMNVLFAKPNTNLLLFQELNKKEGKGFFFTGRKFDFFEVHFSPIYNNNIDNFSIDLYNHIQKTSPEFQLI